MATATKADKADKTEERKVNRTVPGQVKKGNLMALVYWVQVDDVGKGGERLVVSDVDTGTSGIRVEGTQLVEASLSADQFQEEQKVSKTAAAELLITSHNRPLTVVFEKQDGSERTLRGRLVKHEALLGRSMVEDLDLPHTDKNRMRLVDHRTIKSLVVDGVKYVVK